MTFQDFKEQIIIKAADTDTMGNRCVWGRPVVSVKFIMYYQPHMTSHSEFSGWIGERSFLLEDIKQMDINEPYHQVWFELKDRINSYYFNNFCNRQSFQ
jgi:hypothetical protein